MYRFVMDELEEQLKCLEEEKYEAKASKYLVYVFGQCIGQQFFTAQQVRRVERENTDIKLVNIHRY